MWKYLKLVTLEIQSQLDRWLTLLHIQLLNVFFLIVYRASYAYLLVSKLI